MTSQGRTAILSKIRTSMGRKGDDADRQAAVAERLNTAPKGLIPARGQLPKAARVDLFEKMAKAVQASVQRLPSDADIPEAVSSYLRAKNLPQRIRIGADPRVTGLPWDKVSGLEIGHGRAVTTDEATVSHSLAGIAETGTIALISGQDNPTTLNFLPDHHLIVVRASEIEGEMESIWPTLREIYGKGNMPRTVNFVTGPSRSGDIEQKLLLGAHGPRAVHILLVED